MKMLYKLDDAFGLLKIRKRWEILMFISGLFVLLVIIFLTLIHPNKLTMFFDILLSSLYLSVLYTYFGYVRKSLHERYHFYAKIEQFDHEIITGCVSLENHNCLTIFGLEVYEITIGIRKVYLEACFMDLCKDNLCKVLVVDNFVIGVEYDE